LTQTEAVREFKRSLIIDAALDLFDHHAYQEVTVQDIADAAGIGKATVYQYFTSKEEIVHHLMMRTLTDMDRELEQCCAQQKDFRQALEQLIILIYQHYLNHNRLFLTYLGLKLQGFFNSEWREEIRKKRQVRNEILSQLLEQGMAQGFIIKADSMRMARILSHMLRGFSIETLESPEGKIEPEKELSQDLVCAVIFRALVLVRGGETVE
jgi:AcrR family transcriptional regulator